MTNFMKTAMIKEMIKKETKASETIDSIIAKSEFASSASVVAVDVF